MSEKYVGKQTLNSRALSMFIGSALLPGRDGKPQKRLTEKEAYEKAVKEMVDRKRREL